MDTDHVIVEGSQKSFDVCTYVCIMTFIIILFFPLIYIRCVSVICLLSYSYSSPLLDSFHNMGFSPVYIAIFILWCMSVLSQVLLAVVNSFFAEIQQNKFKSLYLHRRSVTSKICTYEC